MSIIQITNLRKVYDEKTVPVHAVNGIDLSFAEGEFVAIVGPSGSGMPGTCSFSAPFVAASVAKCGASAGDLVSAISETAVSEMVISEINNACHPSAANGSWAVMIGGVKSLSSTTNQTK